MKYFFMALVVGLYGTASANLITNGNFESGNSGFISDYFNTGINSGAQTYSITSDPYLEHALATSYGDHTSGSGLMMAVNGAIEPNLIVWGQNVDLMANTDYEFNFSVSSWYPAEFAQLQFSLNAGDVNLGTIIAPSISGQWQNSTISFNSGSLFGSTLLSFVDNELAWGGNDFAIDDLSLEAKSVPEPSFFILLLSSLLSLGFIRRKNG